MLPLIEKHDPSLLLRNLAELTVQHQTLLECLAMAHVPLNQAEAFAAARIVCRCSGIRWDKNRQVNLLSDLLSGFLAQKTASGEYRCRREIAQDVLCISFEEGRAPAIADHFIVERPLGLKAASAKNPEIETEFKIWMLTFALPDSADAFATYIKMVNQLMPFFERIAGGFSRPESLHLLSPNQAFLICDVGLRAAIREGVGRKLLAQWLHQYLTHTGCEIEHIVQTNQMCEVIGLRTGRSEVESIKSKGTTALKALLNAVQGDARAYSILSQNLRTGKGPAFPAPLSNLLLLAAIMRHGSQSDFELVDWGPAQDFETFICQRVGDSHFHEVHIEPRFLEHIGWKPTWSCGLQLLTGIACLWLPDLKALKSLQASLETAAVAYRRCGLPLLADAAAELVRRSRQENPEPNLLLDAYLPAPEGERRFRDLVRWSQEQSSSNLQTERLVWSVRQEQGDWLVEPKVQKKSKKGGWSAGQVCDLQSAATDPPDCCDEHDRRVLSMALSAMAIGGLEETPEELALLALAGHPRVLMGQGKTTVSIAVERAQPRLSVSQKTGELKVRLEPKLDDYDTIQIQQPSSGRLLVFHLSQAQLQLVTILGQDWVSLPKAQVETLREVLSVVASAEVQLDSDLTVAGPSRTVPADSTPRLRLSPDGLGLAGDIVVRPFGDWGPVAIPGEGGQIMIADKEGETLQAMRDLQAEKASLGAAGQAVPMLAQPLLNWPTVEESLDLVEALAETAEGLLLVEWPEGQPFKVVSRASSKSFPLVISSRQDWLELEGELRVSEDNVLSLQALIELASHSSGRFLPLGQGDYLALTQELRQRLDRLSLIGERSAKGPLRVHPMAATVALPESMFSESNLWAERRQLLAQSSRLKPQLPAELQAELRPYQKEGFVWMSRLAHWGAGACLADDMGLGKTVQALALILDRASVGPTLVVAPTSVCANWADEAARFAPTLKVCLLAEHDRQAVLTSPGAWDVILCSYGLLVNESEHLGAVSWRTVVLDEAQSIKNHTTQRFKAALALRAEFRLATTGTPIENNLEELWSLFRFLNPGLLGSRASFVARFAKPVSQGDIAVQETLRVLIRPFILRRNKSEVLQELPPKTEITLSVELSTQEMSLYESLRRQAVEAVNGSDNRLFVLLAQMMRLRRACCHPKLVLPEATFASSKLELLTELLQELKANGHRALVFSQFVDHLALVRQRLEQKGYSYQYLDGSTPTKKRKEAVTAFQAGQSDLFLISLKAGGVGLNLTAADYVVHLDPWWNPAVEDQASDRAHRIGQQRPVTVYRLVATNTIEQKIVALHESKRDLAERLLEGTDKVNKLDADELLRLLQHQ